MKKIISLLLVFGLLISSAIVPAAYASEEKAIAEHDNHAIIKEVAMAYYRQGPQIVYDKAIGRREVFASPEDATAQRTGYQDCSTFVNCCYREAFGENIVPVEIVDSPTTPKTSTYMNYSKANPESPDVIGFWDTENYSTEQEQQALLNSIRNQLQIGDILGYHHGAKRTSSNHVYIYMGDGVFMHSTGGGSYTENTKDPAKSYDGDPGELQNGTIGFISADAIFSDTTSSRYLFRKTSTSKVWEFCLLRPLARGLTPTEKTVNRMKIAGLSMEKVSSVFENSAVHTGDVITYTVTLENTNESLLSDVEIKDTLPQGTEFVSGSDGVWVDSAALTWKGNVPANSIATVSYSVLVTATEPGTLLKSDSTYVSGVKLGNITHSVSGFSKDQERAINQGALEYVEKAQVFESSLDMVTALYKNTLGMELLQNVTEKDILDNVIDTENYTLVPETDFSRMVAPNLFGGSLFRAAWRYYPANKDITRLISEAELAVGDIIVAEWAEGSIVYLYAGDSTLVTVEDGIAKKLTIGKNIYGTDADNILVSLLAYSRFAVMRPSMTNTSSVVPVLTEKEDNKISVTINEIPREFDVMPIIENGRTLVPMRAIFETLGATILWDEATRTVTAAKGETVVMLQIDNPTAWVNGEATSLDSPAKIVDGRTLVPIRFVAETLGCNVDWENDTRTVIIKKDSEVHFTGESLDGKKVLVIGNDLLHYGRIVEDRGKSYLAQEERQDTKGGLVQLCKAKGINVSVTNWSLSSHSPMDFVGGEECSVCKEGVIHMNYLPDKYFDYIFVSPAGDKAQAKTLISDIEYIEKTFKAVNPDVKILILGNVAAYGNISTGFEPTEIASQYVTLDAKGFKVLDFGKIVTDVIMGKTEVPGSKEVFTHNSFINKDGKRANLLTGYISTLLAYCEVTGEAAVGQPYSYVHDTSLAPTFDIPGYRSGLYLHGADATNFDEIFESEYEVECIQKLVDKYLGR